MPRLSKEIKDQIKSLPLSDLQDFALKIASKEKSAFDFLNVNYLDKESGEQELFEDALADIDMLFIKGYKGYSEILKTTNMLSACIKRTNEFTKVSKNKLMEADLLVYVLDEAFNQPADFFATCFTGFDSKVGQILKRLITLVTKKLHPDHLLDYRDKINRYLNRLHKTSNHLDQIFDLPSEI